MKINNKNIPYYIIVVGIFGLLKFGFTLTEIKHLEFLLKPTNKIIELLMASKSVYLSEGYFHEKLNIIIDKSCSGYNFWILCFLLFSYLFINHLSKSLHKIIIIPMVLFFTYIITVFVNSSRIFASIIVQNQTQNIFQNEQHIIHESIGIITNLSFLILTYYLIDKLLNRKNYEKLA